MNEEHKNSGFKTPENYFEGFNDRLSERLKEDESTLPENAGLKVPEGYFDSLNEQITDKLQQTTSTKVVKLYPHRKYYLAAAAIAALFILVLGIQQFGDKELTFDSLANSDIENYLDNTDLGLSSYEIAEVVALDDIAIDNILEHELIEESIIDYLDENVDDFDELNLELDE
ncbi:hypothetical protein [Muriicola sp. Z0-33]|uniref:hypothetical protein n=1 Tax=Muriicola sp. Z0-33 TaxID=2816957 RepID=UPI002238E1AF|nr:hypothetical protein [Muriicola sp. Z0-33]MCW5517053.1 hypothetical protein [Muriicola sp. Z0-33]